MATNRSRYLAIFTGLQTMFSDMFGLAAGKEMAKAMASSSLRASSTRYPYASRKPGDLAHKRWKLARASGRR